MIKKTFSIFILFLCLGLFLVGCPKKTVKFTREQPSAQKSEEARKLEAERAAKEAREAQETKERELARVKEEEAQMAQDREPEKSLVAKKERGIEGEVNEALILFSQQVKGGKEFLNTSKGVLVIPNIVKAGLVVGGQYGEGALRIRGKTVDYYSIAAGSVGFQIGAQKMNLILVFMQDEALKKFRTSSGWKAGVDGSVVFIDVGAGKSLDTVNVEEPIAAFMFGQKGLMAAATIEGAKFTKLVK